MANQDILFRIYYLLKTRPYSIAALHRKLTMEGVAISKRSVYRYIDRLATALNNGTELIEVENDIGGKQYFFIRNIEHQEPITQNDWLLYLNNFFIFKQLFNLSQDEINLNQRILNSLQGNAPLKAQLTSIINYSDEAVESTHFGEVKLSNRDKRLLYKFLYYLISGSIFQIDNYTEYVRNNQFIPKIQTPLKPVDVLVHKGNYCIRCVSLNDRLLHSLEIESLVSISRVGVATQDVDVTEILKQDDYRFGYHHPLVNGVHEVKLLFPEIPGEHVISRMWHPSQRFTRFPDGFIEFRMKVEINIELLGWIGMWLENVKVLEPPILVEMMHDKFRSMLEIIEQNRKPFNNG